MRSAVADSEADAELAPVHSGQNVGRSQDATIRKALEAGPGQVRLPRWLSLG